jgi:hypothetical protein
LTVRFEEFLLPGKWQVVAAPPTVKALPEDRAVSHDIVLRRVIPAQPADSTVAPTAEPAPSP